NVKGILDTENGIFLEKILSGLKKAGYTVNFKLLNSADFGVPQRRSRVFIVGSLHGLEYKSPNSTHQPPTTANEAILDLPILTNGANLGLAEYNEPPTNSHAKKMRGGLKFSSNHLVTRNSELVIERYKYIPQGGNWEDIPDALMNNYKDKTRCHTG